MEGVSSNKRFLESLQDRCDKDLTSNQITSVKIYRIPITKESEFPKIYTMTDEKVYLEKVYYNGVYVSLYFNNQDSFGSKELQVYMEADLDE